MAGSVCPAPLIKKCFEQMGATGLIIVYGMTELSPVATLMGPDAPFEKKVNTVGHAAPNVEIKLINEQGVIVPRGQEGEICIRGYLVMKEYWDEPE